MRAEIARDSGRSIRCTYDKICNLVPPGTPIPNFNSIRTSMSEERRKHFPKMPRSIFDLVDLPGKFILPLKGQSKKICYAFLFVHFIPYFVLTNEHNYFGKIGEFSKIYVIEGTTNLVSSDFLCYW